MTVLPLRPHQEKALDQLKDGNILWGGVGAGKTRVALEYYLRNHDDQLLVVITTAKKRDHLDWEAEAAPFGIGKDDEATLAGPIIVDSWNNIQKYAQLENAFFIFDEQRLVGSGGWSKTFLRIAKHNDWIMLSATPGDTWMDYVPVFIANGFYKNRTEFRLRHVVYAPYTKYPKVERYLEVGVLVRHRNSILVRMKDERHTNRVALDVLVGYDPDLYDRVARKRWNPWEERPLRDSSELYYGLRRVVNQHIDRVAAVDRLLQKHPRVIVFYNFDYELELLRHFRKHSKYYGGLPVVEWNGHLHEHIPDTERWLYLVQYTAGSEGWNCITTDTMVFFSLPDSYKKWEQAHGRIDRLNTPYINLFYYYLRSKSGIDQAIWGALGRKENFNVGALERLLLGA